MRNLIKLVALGLLLTACSEQELVCNDCYRVDSWDVGQVSYTPCNYPEGNLIEVTFRVLDYCDDTFKEITIWKKDVELYDLKPLSDVCDRSFFDGHLPPYHCK